MNAARRPRPSKTQPPRPAGARRPGVAAHRVFPVIAAVWSAALFGLGSLAAGTGVLIALLLAGLGGGIGLVIGVVLHIRAGGALPKRPVRTAEPAPAAQPEQPVSDDMVLRVRSRDAHPDAPPRRPLVVTQDVLPYPTSMVEPPPAPVPESVLVTDAPEPDDDHTYDPPAASGDLPPFLAAAMSAVRKEQGEAPRFVAPAEPIIVSAAHADAEAEASIVELTTVAPEWDATTETVPAEITPAEIAPAAAPAPMGPPPPLASLAAAAPKVALNEVPVASLGLVQLIERLALAIAARQANRAAEPVPKPEAIDPQMPLHRFDPLTMDPAGPLLRAKKARTDTLDLAIGAAEEGVTSHRLHDPLASVVQWTEDHGDEPLPARFLGQPLRDEPIAEPAAVVVADSAADSAGEAAPTVEHRYSSLADMALPRPELLTFVAPADHHDGDAHDDGLGAAAPASTPVVQFPSRHGGGDPATHSPSPTEADRALRDALATLRQMSAQR